MTRQGDTGNQGATEGGRQQIMRRTVGVEVGGKGLRAII